MYYLTKAGAENVTIDDIDLNLFSGILKIEQLKIRSDRFEPLSLSSAVFNISMLRLFTGKLLVERAVIDGLEVVVENNPETIVMGFPLVSKKPDENLPDEKSEESALPFGIKNILLTNSVVKYKDEKSSGVIDINTIRLFDFYCWKKNTPAVLKVDALVNTAKLEADIVMKPFAETKSVDSRIRLDQFKLGSFSGYLTDYVTDFQTIITTDLKISAKIDQNNTIEVEQSGSFKVAGIKGEPLGLPVPVKLVNAAFSYDGSAVLTLASGKDFPVFNLNGTFSNDDFNAIVNNDKIEVNHDGLSWTGSVKNTTGIVEETEITGNVVIDNFFINGEDRQKHLISLDKLSLNTINIVGKNEVDLNSAVFSGIGVAVPVLTGENKAQKNVTPFETGSIVINKIQLADMNKLNVESVEIENVIVPLERNTDGTLPLAERMKKFTDNINALIATTDTSEAETSKTDTAKKESEKEKQVKADTEKQLSEKLPVEISKSRFIVAVGSLNLKGENVVNIQDSYVTPSYSKTISIEKFALTDISNVNVDDAAKLEVKIKTEKHGSIDINGDVQLFNPKVTLRLKGNVKGIHLAELSPYSASALGYNIKTGVFNTKMDFKVVADKLNVKNDMFVENIILIPNVKGKVKKFTRQFLMPVDQTLSILRDDNNNVKLSIPVTGDIKNPDFHYTDVMKIAMIKAVKTASISVIKNLIQPYGVVITAAQYAMKGKEYIEKIRLKPVMFTPGSPEIENAGMDYLDTIVKLLNKKKELRLSVCGFSIKSDMEAFDPVKNPDPFVQLAKQRQSNVVLYLENKGISHKRLFQCNGDIDSDKKAFPRVEMSL